MDPASRYASPPVMQQANVGLSGHNQFKAPGLQTVVPPRMDNPYVDPYAGIKSHSIKKIVLNSVNANTISGARERLHIPPGAENSDFTIQIGDDLQSIAQNNVASISLSDITFPGGQYLVEEQWSHIDFSEGIVITEDFRLITLLFRNLFDNGDDLLLEAKLPLAVNEITDVDFHNSKTFDITLASEAASSITTVQALWNDGLRLDAFAPSSKGTIILGKNSAKITPFPDKKKFRVELLDDQSVNSGSAVNWGYLTTANLPSPAHLAEAVNGMIQNADAFQSLGYTKKSGSIDPTYIVPRFNMIFGWRGETDVFSYSYSCTDQAVTPELAGPLYAYMGFREGTCPPDLDETFSVEVNALSKRQAYELSGTFVVPGQYEYPNVSLFHSAIADAFTGNWFGPMNKPVDGTTDKFILYFKYKTDVIRKIEVHSGRYTPDQLAAAIQDEITFADIQVTAEVDCGKFKGLSFTHAEPTIPFTLMFNVRSPDPVTNLYPLDPQWIGYLPAEYSGCTHYEPEVCPRWYPTFYQGDNCDTASFLPTQNYGVFYDDLMRKFRFKARAFSTLETTIDSQTDNIVTLATPIAHGASGGMRVVLHDGTTNVTGIVLDSPDPFKLVVQYGGSTPLSGTVYVNFVSRTWNWNADFTVDNCIIRQAIGVDAAFYVMDKGITSFGLKSRDRLVIFDTLTLLSPNCIQLFPFEYVFIVVTFNHKDGEGVTMGIQTKKHGEEINGSVVHALARIPIGRFSPESHSDAFDRHYEIQSIGVSKISSIRIQILNPDLSYYRSHGKHISVGLLLNVVGERFLTTQ